MKLNVALFNEINSVRIRRISLGELFYNLFIITPLATVGYLKLISTPVKYRKSKLQFLYYLEITFSCRWTIRVLQDFDVSQVHLIVPLRPDSLMLAECAKRLDIPFYLYDWGVSSEKYPKSLLEALLFIKSERYDLNKTNQCIVFGNPVENRKINTNSLADLDELVIIDRGLSKSFDIVKHASFLDAARGCLIAIEEQFGRRLKLTVKPRNDSPNRKL